LPDPPYLILLTARARKEDVVTGLESGADDYVTKPFDRSELLSRVRTGERIVGLQANLAQRVRELEEALAQVNRLQGLLPICSYCKKVRDDGNYWHEVERYIADHADVHFSHGICPNCWYDVVAPELEAQGIPLPPLPFHETRSATERC
jgi:response regulator RpfG family c-di-GMP phosphodiesterase